MAAAMHALVAALCQFIDIAGVPHVQTYNNAVLKMTLIAIFLFMDICKVQMVRTGRRKTARSETVLKTAVDMTTPRRSTGG